MTQPHGPEAWRGQPDQVTAGQQSLHRRARCAGAAALGRYTASMERESVVA